MNKNEVVSRVAHGAGIPRSQTIRALKCLVTAIRDTVNTGGKISLTGLGTFKVKSRKARPGRNPKTGETILIPQGRKISFKPSLSFKKLIKSPPPA